MDLLSRQIAMSTSSKRLFVLCGNDGTGKSTVVKRLRQIPNVLAIERSADGEKYGIDVEQIDRLTLTPTFDPSIDRMKTDFQSTLVLPGDDTPTLVYWVILDADIPTILQRIKDRPTTNEWESEKALFYFRQRFREMAAYFGFPLIETTPLTIDEVVTAVVNVPQYYEELQFYALRNLTADNLEELDLEDILWWHIKTVEESTEGFAVSPDEWYTYQNDELPTSNVYQMIFKNMNIGERRSLFIRWLVADPEQIVWVDHNHLRVSRDRFSYTIQLDASPLLLMAEGESKKVYKFVTQNPYLAKLGIIKLKSTIYSHSKQATGEIQGLGRVRAIGTQIFLEMMYRNGLSHSYRSINDHGVIVSELIPVVPPTEIVVKKWCEGTDKYSYYQIRNCPEIVLPTGEYVSGPYVRFDWRNPNHLDKTTGLSVAQNRYYYLFEASVGKEAFFKMHLSNTGETTPFGDKTISEELLTGTIQTFETKRQVLKMFLTIQAYFHEVGLEIKDVCFMLDATGGIFWSEINQDCMRIKVRDDSSTSFDKDIWRAAGSSGKDVLVKKWLEFNRMMTGFFCNGTAHAFHKTEMLRSYYPFQLELQRMRQDRRLRIPASLETVYQSMLPREQRRVIVTMDLQKGQPVLVKSGQISALHNGGDIDQALAKIAIFPDILVVDLDGALGVKSTVNREIIRKLGPKYYIHTGGGLRTLSDVEDVLKHSVRRVVLGSASDELIKQTPKERLIIELSLNEENQILLFGRQTVSPVSLQQRLKQLAEMGVEAISITFHHTEGHLRGLPRDQIIQLMTMIPGSIHKVIIAGGISTIQDLEFLWTFPGVIPQLGSALWTNTLQIGDVYHAMCQYDSQGNIPAIIQDTDGRVKGLVYMNEASIRATCETRQLHRFSRKLQKVLMKGATSGRHQKVSKMVLDCDNDSILITVDATNTFCHNGNHSCFSLQTSVKGNLVTLSDHIRSSMTPSSPGGTISYSARMQQNPSLALAKLMEEYWEIFCAPNDQTQVYECSDFLVHMLMYLNGIGISLEDIMNELNARRWAPKLTVKSRTVKGYLPFTEIVIAITPSKYVDQSDNFCLNELGFKVTRGEGRSLQLDAEIVDPELFLKAFGRIAQKVTLIGIKPKDMPLMLLVKRVDYVVTYENVMRNFPNVYRPIKLIVDPTISLALICRTEDAAKIDPTTWTPENKVLIAAEHVWHVTQHLTRMGVSPHCYHLDRIIGGSEGFLVSQKKYLLCDAVVSSGQTLIDNNLTIWQTMVAMGESQMGLYGGL